MPLRIMMLLAATTVLAAASAPAAAAQYCAFYTSDGGNCGFSSLQQCSATVSGVGGFCFVSPGEGFVAQRGVPATAMGSPSRRSR
jgi:predicted S18 family serine protease